MIHHVETWLKKKPNKSEIVEIQTDKGKVNIIPQKIIESLLDELTEQNWSTKNFQFSRYNEIVDNTLNPGGSLVKVGRTMCDASLELVVTYRAMVPAPLHTGNGPVSITRVLVGAVSFDVSFFGNDHIANTAKSLCITNAASDLGRRFGKDLNPREPAMLLLGIKKPIDVLTAGMPVHSGQVSEEAKNKIGESLDKIKNSLKKNNNGNVAE